jgi:hypothetical protein
MTTARCMQSKTCACVLLALTATVRAQSPVAPPAAAKLPDASAHAELVENPVTNRLAQLAVVETSLQLVNDAIDKAGAQSNSNATKAKQYSKNNELMNRNAGGPVSWEKFYGKTANQFFRGAADGRRPPQFDYIYKANSDQVQAAQQEIAALGGKIDKLQDRRRNLEAKQVTLWTQVTTALVAQRDIDERPLYSFHLKGAPDDSAADITQRVAAAESLARYLRLINHSLALVNDEVTKDQAAALQTLKYNAEQAQKNLVRDLAGVDSDIRLQTDDLADSAKRLKNVSTSAVDARQTALDAETAGDVQQRLSSRALLQTAIIDLADRTATLDEGIVKLASQWKIVPDSSKPLPELSLLNPAPRPAVSAASISPVSTEGTSRPKTAGNAIDAFQVGSVWSGKAGGRRGGDGTRSITVLERNGSGFKARFDGPARSSIIQGTVQDGKISYKFEEPGRGKAANEITGTLTDDKIVFDNAGPPMTLVPNK